MEKGQDMDLNKISQVSEREFKVLIYVAEGYTDKEIGVKLHISTSTVIFHRKNLKCKLKCKNTAQLIYTATKQNLI